MIEVRNLQYEGAEWEPIENWKKDLDVVYGWFALVLQACENNEPATMKCDQYTLIVDPSHKEIILVAQCTVPGREDMEFTDVALEYRICEPMTLELTV